MNVSIALVEDNGINRHTFLQKLQHLPGYVLAFTAEDGHDCLEQLKGAPEAVQPQVIFMDIEMPQMDGIETIRLAKALYAHIHFIVLTVFDDDDKIFEAIRAGASGYLLKHEPAAALHDAIVNVLEFNGAPMSPAIARKALKLLGRSEKPGAAVTNQLPVAITEREKQVLECMVNGWDSKRIASSLNISTLTVRKHIANIYEKLHISSKAEVITLALRNKWFPS